MAERRLPPKKTKIVCTIGSASESRETLERMIRNGMNVARLNFAHGDVESHSRVIENIRAAAAAVGERVAIMGDLPGPKMRIGRLAEESINLERDQPFILQTEEMLGDASRVSMSFADLPQAVRTGDKIYLNDGFVQLAVEKVEGGRFNAGCWWAENYVLSKASTYQGSTWVSVHSPIVIGSS